MPNHPTSASGVPGCAGVRGFHRRAARPRPGGAPRPAQPDGTGPAGPPAPRPPAHLRHLAPGRPPAAPAGHTVVCPDLRGYGAVLQAADTPDHAQYSKRAMAADVLALDARLGHERFAVVGHDRGSYVALRLALDHPTRVTRLAVLDSVPDRRALARCDARFADRLVALVLLRPARQAASGPSSPIPTPGTAARPERMGADAYAEYRQAIHDPETVRAMLEDYRAGLARRPRATTRPTGRPVGASRARRWSCGRATTTSSSSTAIRSRIWAAWADDLRGGHASTPGTTWPRKRPARSRRRCSRSSGPWRTTSMTVLAASSTRSSAAVTASRTTPRRPRVAVGVALVVRARPAAAQVAPELADGRAVAGVGQRGRDVVDQRVHDVPGRQRGASRGAGAGCRRSPTGRPARRPAAASRCGRGRPAAPPPIRGPRSPPGRGSARRAGGCRAGRGRRRRRGPRRSGGGARGGRRSRACRGPAGSRCAGAPR